MSRADLALLLICAIWGTTFALLREALRVLTPAELIAIRFTIATLALVLLYGGRFRGFRLAWLRDGLWVGVWVAVGYLTQAVGLRTINPSRSAFITSMSIAFVPFIAFAMLRTPPVLGETLGVALAVAGLVLFSSDASFSLRAGELWTLLGAAAFAMQIVTLHVAGKRSPAVPISVIQTAAGAGAGWALVLGAGGMHADPRAIPWGVLLYLALVATAFIMVVQTWALARTSSVKAGVLYATEPVFAAIFAISFFGDRMTAREVTGAGLILAGVVVSELWRPLRARFEARRLSPEASGRSSAWGREPAGMEPAPDSPEERGRT